MQHRPYIHPTITLLNTTITSQLLADSERPGINTDSNVETNGNPIEGDASGAHSKPFDLDTEEVWGDGWE
ncbi:hypothetical protein HMPREF0645_1428 [Hallella bergensis DSM 17361]|uniref:Uncharacterized protein n=1 Tax=Hallella bergensis DSM 17361 TaxID=585502 RepID=D1PWU3_9BACT|nr:hypothetical protein [Hallella bergensis]EFA44117.1 hypothetical protein HMPREF0645_1428 [Hallella bergensis DSM 17361]